MQFKAICFDLDGTLVTEHMTKGTDSDYHLAEPIPNAIEKVHKDLPSRVFLTSGSCPNLPINITLFKLPDIITPI